MAEEKLFCPYCGAEVKPGAKFCNKCGSSLASLYSTPDSTQQPNPQNSQNQTQPNHSTQADYQPKATNSNFQDNPGQNYRGQENQSGDYRRENNYRGQQRQTGSTDQAVDQTFRAAKQYSDTYFSWFMRTLKYPRDIVTEAHPYFGITSFVISLVLMLGSAAMITKFLKELINNSFLYVGGWLTYGDSSNWSPTTLGNIDALRAAAIAVIFVAAWLLIGFVASRLGGSIDKNGFFSYTTLLAGFTNSAIVVEAVLLVITLLAGKSPYGMPAKVIFGLLVLIGIIYTVGFVYSIIREDIQARMDKIYVVICAEAAGLIASLILLEIFVH